MSSPFKMEFKKTSGDGGSSLKRKRQEAPKKHRSSEFCPWSSRGIVRKLDAADVRSLISDPDSQFVMRHLGKRTNTFSSQQTVYLESVVEVDEVGSLEEQVANLQGTLTSMSKRWETQFDELAKETKGLREQTKGLREQLELSQLFLHQGMSISLRCFCDIVFAAFFKACGKESAGFEERSAWLARSGEEYVSREPVTLLLFGVEKKIGKPEFPLIKTLRKVSSELSSTVWHSATPLEVATALEKEGASVFAGDFKDICSLFRVLFGVSSKKMVKDWKEGKLKKEFQKKFKPARPPQI